MSDIVEEPTLLCPQAQCTRCKAPEGIDPAKTNIENWRCPQCGTKFCVRCFAPNYHGDGHTFFCPNPSCKQLLKFP